jgi:hypothetical protein
MFKTCNTSIPHNSPVGWRQLELFPLSGKHLKPQISSIPGISVTERRRYRVIAGERILGDRLTLEEALKLAKRGEG